MGLSILVEKGDPMDLRQYRHTAFYLQSLSESPIQSYHSPSSSPPPFTLGSYNTAGRLLQIVGTQGEYEFTSQILASKPTGCHREIPVRLLHGTDTVVWNLIASTGIEKSIKEWNCQSWVRDALKNLKLGQLLGGEEHTRVLDAFDEVLNEVPLDTA